MRRAACAARRVLWASRACGWTKPHGAGKMDKMDQGKMDLSLDMLGLRVLSFASAHAYTPTAARAPPARSAGPRRRQPRALCRLQGDHSYSYLFISFQKKHRK